MKQVLDVRLGSVMEDTGTAPPETPNGPGGARIHPHYREKVLAALSRAGGNAGALRALLRETSPNDAENEAASFLIAFMPDDDLRSLTGEYLLDNIRFLR